MYHATAAYRRRKHQLSLHLPAVVSAEVLGLSLEERQRLQQQAIEEMDDEWERELDARNKAKAGIEEE